MANDRAVLTKKEAAKLLEMTVRNMDRYLERGDLDYIKSKANGRVYIYRESAEKLARDLRPS